MDSDPNADLDLDGRSNLLKYATRTGLLVLGGGGILSISADPMGKTLNFPYRPGASDLECFIEYSPDLVTSWIPLASYKFFIGTVEMIEVVILSGNPTILTLHDLRTRASKGFYRIKETIPSLQTNRNGNSRIAPSRMAPEFQRGQEVVVE